MLKQNNIIIFKMTQFLINARQFYDNYKAVR